ncbi:SusC/RagA family TonB-linked outer membrane protein [Oceanihabitans sp. IOP_32]|uniref:SusC/RagA family TonB-linked outer membrane protein n=1 Tax=Oceanihabitans sp. IOP_32 TaxID=2529032 RepID=UPI0012936C72|nr:SusC/RagA family TonB-linked outer membrane protein [Oceanihabitans sp. IOP_32]QFZ54604.1 SusC/RagA family TonB-linked outer membrane protein [Oceanihabitans sp. IOP_32]
MKKKTTLLLLVFFTSTCSFLFSQNITVNGQVTDASNMPLPGVNIQVKGTTTGTATDFDGNYTVLANRGDVLIFSFLGFKTKEVAVLNASLNVRLEEDTDQLDEVVITAFGVAKRQKSLGYSVTQIDASDVSFNGQNNALEALQGQVAGVQINRTSGSAGGGVDILIRGITSVNPARSNQPLIIVDGLALNNDTFSGEVRPSAGSNSASSSEQFAFSNRAGDINSEDIESYSILKGAAATALYGVRASNGAIIITTKKGKLGKAKLNLTASTTFRNVQTTPDDQTEYREGFNNLPRTLYTPETDLGFTRLGGTSFYSWGPRFSENSATLDNGNVVDLSNDAYYSPYDIFRTGLNTQINLNVSGASETMDYFLSVGNSNDEGILPNTDYEKTNLRLKAGYKVTNNFNINSSVSYSKSGGKRANGGDKSVMSALSYFSGTFPINDFRNPDGSERDYSFGIIDNPRYLMETSSLVDDVNRWIGNATFNWQPKEWVNITYAAQIDNYSDRRNRYVGPDLDGGSQVGGFILNQNINSTALESNFLVAFSKTWSEDFTTDLTLGHQLSDTKRNYDEARGEGLNIAGVNEIGNTTNYFIDSTVEQLRNMGVFGELKLAYKDKLFLTLTGRNDWLSTLPKENRSFFYPSASLAYDISDLFGDNDTFTFGKLRASWAEVGKGPNFGETGSYFVVDGDFPFTGVGGFRRSTLLGDQTLIPERNQSIEFGADLRFFDSRFRIDYAYFNTRVKDQIFNVGTAYSSGLSAITRNAGDYEVFGHELLLSADIIRRDSFKWNMSLNWSTSEGNVLDIPDDIQSIIFADSGFAGVTSEIREGDKMGNLYGYKWRYENGQRYIGSDGLPRVNLDEKVIVGNAFPDYIASITNSFKWKGLGFNFVLEYKKGGDLYDSGLRNSIRNGVRGLTAFRNVNTVLPGVMDDGNGGFIANTIETTIDQNYYRSSTRYNRASEILVQDASWVKLRNIGLSYDLGSNILEKLKIERLSFNLSANNILLWTPFDGFDPEGNQYSAGSNVYGFTGLSIPLSQSYSFGINVTF